MAFKVEIVNINENADNIILVSGLTIERLKIRYNWVLNASVKDCIIGEDDYGLVWYSGEWVCGEWIDGTWYSGIWHDGIWDNGKWYSYLIDKAMVVSNRFVILDKNETYSEFRSGLWKQGDFYDGIFGYDRDISGKAYSDLTGKTFSSSYWEDGKFHDGIFTNSVWYNGIFYYGNMINSYWLNGKFYSGTFNHHQWYDGIWYGGDFVIGDWLYGTFDRINSSINSRFGTADLEKSQTIWKNGNFYNGEFHSGLNIDASGNTIPSIDSNKTHWINGNFYGGKWYGGHFHNGKFYTGNWYGGVFNTDTGTTNASACIWYDGNWYNGLWINGIFYDGHFYDGMWMDGQFVNGYMSTNTIENPLLQQILSTNVVAPTVITNSATTIMSTSVIGNGRVTNNGGATILDRGICWAFHPNIPVTGNTLSNWSVSDGGAMGNISILLNGLSVGTVYNTRAYARNITGLTYGNLISFTTETSSNSVPAVNVTGFPNLIDISTNVTCYISNNNGSDVTLCGVYYSDTNTLPGPTDNPTPGVVPLPAPGTGQFTVTLSSLTPDTTYWVRAYAENGTGRNNSSSVWPFHTSPSSPAVVPSLTTIDPIAAIADISAITYGVISSPGNAIITTVGACWSTSPNPTIADSHTTDVFTVNSFNTLMTGLIPNTLYHVRAYATNSAGTGYGNDVTFTTLPLRTLPSVDLLGVTAE